MDPSKLLNQMTQKEKADMCGGDTSWTTYPIPRLGIKSMVMTDGTYGLRYVRKDIEPSGDILIDQLNLDSESDLLSSYHQATCFCSPSAFACSWDRALVSDIALAIAEECAALGVDLLLAPAINIRRDPRCGRGFEYYSEDPFLTAELGTAFVLGLRKNGIGACLKHFACNNAERLRTNYNSIVDEKTLREIYLYAFERIVKKAQPMAIMSAYNDLNGVQCSENKKLLTTLLRDEWGYTGMVVSDWGAIKNRISALEAGCDLEMPANPYFCDEIAQAIGQGRLSEEVLDGATERILNAVMNRPNPAAKQRDHHAMAISAAEQSCVLLKNKNGALPLSKSINRLLVVGELAEKPRYQGGGCAVVNPNKLETPLHSIRAVLGERVAYAKGCDRNGQTTPQLLQDVLRESMLADAVVVFAGVCSGDTEGKDRETLAIAPGCVATIRAAAESKKPLIVVLTSGDAVTVGDFEADADAILETFYFGEGGGEAVARLLFGDANPSGKLTVTFPAAEQDLPSYLHFDAKGYTRLYGEGEFVGYRYYDKRKIAPQYEFGFGLSYTQFEYSDMTVSLENSEATAKITNIGDRDGAEIAQLYVQKDGYRQLKGFDKVFIKRGESATVKVELEMADAFSRFDERLGRFVVQPAEYAVMWGASSRDIRQTAHVKIAEPPAFAPLKADSPNTELLGNPKAREIYARYLRRIGVLKPGEDESARLQAISGIFWGLYRTLIMLATGDPNIKLNKQEFDSVLEEINSTPR